MNWSFQKRLALSGAVVAMFVVICLVVFAGKSHEQVAQSTPSTSVSAIGPPTPSSTLPANDISKQEMSKLADQVVVFEQSFLGHKPNETLSDKLATIESYADPVFLSYYKPNFSVTTVQSNADEALTSSTIIVSCSTKDIQISLSEDGNLAVVSAQVTLTKHQGDYSGEQQLTHQTTWRLDGVSWLVVESSLGV